MRVGVFTPLLSQLSLEDVLEKLSNHKIDTVELGTGNYPGDAHCKLTMLDQPADLSDFKKIMADHGFTISALSCHGNPLHPDGARAKRDREVSRKTIRLAEKLGVPVVIDFSGCPGDSPKSTGPNWVTCPWPPDYLEILKWQWDEVVAPYWIEHARFAEDHGVKIAIEMHPGFVVYSPETMLQACERSQDLRLAVTTILVTCSGKRSILSPRFACSATLSFTCTQKILRFTIATCRLRGCSILSRTPMNAIEPGSSAPVAMGTAKSGGGSSPQLCECSDTITFSRSNMRIACCRPKRASRRPRHF